MKTDDGHILTRLKCCLCKNQTLFISSSSPAVAIFHSSFFPEVVRAVD